MNKTKDILRLLEEGKGIEEIAVEVECKTAYVYQISCNNKRDLRVQETILAANAMLESPTQESCNSAYDALTGVFETMSEDQKDLAKAMIAELLGGN